MIEKLRYLLRKQIVLLNTNFAPKISTTKIRLSPDMVQRHRRETPKSYFQLKMAPTGPSN
jgi:hypothetical protein